MKEQKENPFGLQAVLDNAAQAGRAEEMKTSEQLMLGEFIMKLEMIDQDLPIYFDDLKHRPTSIDSWRGSYCELSINYEGGGSILSDEIDTEHKHLSFPAHKTIDTNLPKDVKVKDLLEILKMAMGK